MAAEVRITIVTSSDGGAVKDIEKGLDSLGKTAKDAGGGFSALKEIGIGALRELGTMGIGLVMDGLKSLSGAVMDGISDAREAAKINAQTAAVLKSTGNAAGVSAEHIQDYASALSAAAGKSLFGDDQIQQSENMLLTFTNIKGTVLDAATAISVDMAQALGGAPQDNAIQLGKALNDPIKGITALTRVGVTFTQEQKDMIQAMVDTGDTAGAQQVILAELNKEFGGSAEAAAKADGGWAQFNDRLGEAKESIGTAILPLLGMLAGFLNDTIAPAIETVAAAFDPFIKYLQAVVTDGDFMNDWLAHLPESFQPIALAIGQVVAFLKDGLTAAFQFLTETAIPALIAGWGQIQPAIAAAVPIIQSIVGAFTSAGDSTSQFGQILTDAGAIWTQYKNVVQAELSAILAIIQAVLAQIMIFWQAHGAEITAFLQATWTQIVTIVQLALQLLQETLIPALQAIAAFIQAHGDEIQTILTVVWETIKTIVTTALAIVQGIITAALALIKGDWSGAWAAIQQICQTIVLAIWQLLKLNFDLITGLFHTTWDGIKAYFQGIMDSIVGWVIQTFEAIKNAIVSSAGKLRSAAGGVADAIVDGIASGIADGAGKIISAAISAARAALDAAMDFLDAGSPSKKFMELGKWSAEGMAVGLAAGAPMVAGAGEYAASAAVSGAQSVTNRNFTYSPQINNYGHMIETMDYSLANALAGAGG